MTLKLSINSVTLWCCRSSYTLLYAVW